MKFKRRWYLLIIPCGLFLLILGGSTSAVVDATEWYWWFKVVGHIFTAIGGFVVAIGWYQKSQIKPYATKKLLTQFDEYARLPSNDSRCVEFVTGWEHKIALAADDGDYNCASYLIIKSMIAAVDGPQRCRDVVADMYKNLLTRYRDNMFFVVYLFIGMSYAIPQLKGLAELEAGMNQFHKMSSALRKTIDPNYVPPKLKKAAQRDLQWALATITSIAEHVLEFDRNWLNRNRDKLLAIFRIVPFSFVTSDDPKLIDIQTETAKDILQALSPIENKLS